MLTIYLERVFRHRSIHAVVSRSSTAQSEIFVLIFSQYRNIVLIRLNPKSFISYNLRSVDEKDQCRDQGFVEVTGMSSVYTCARARTHLSDGHGH